MKNAIAFNGTDSIFASRLRQLMKYYTHQDLASAIGTTRQAIGQYMEGASQPTIEKLFHIAKYLNVSADYLIGLTDCPKIGKIEVKALCNRLGLSENTIEMLLEDAEIYENTDSKRDSFVEFFNVFADIRIADFGGDEWFGHYIYDDIMNYLKHQKTKHTDPTLVHEVALVDMKDWQEGKERPQYLGSMHEEDLLSVFFLQIQRNLRKLKSKLDEVKYFEDGGLNFRIDVHQKTEKTIEMMTKYAEGEIDHENFDKFIREEKARKSLDQKAKREAMKK